MTDKDIQAAALKFSKGDGAKAVGFQAGVKWYKNTIWHNGDEKPLNTGFIFIECMYKGLDMPFYVYRLYFSYENWTEVCDRHDKILRWCYAKDIVFSEIDETNANDNAANRWLSENIVTCEKIKTNINGNNQTWSLNEYQAKALETANYKYPIIYTALGIAGEAGEVADKVKKVIRDNNGQFSKDSVKALAYEIGDVLWFCATLADDLNIPLQEIAEMNYKKLNSRKERGTIGGSGDNR